MSYTLTVPQRVVRDAEAYAENKGMTLDQLVCDYLVMVVKSPAVKQSNDLKIGLMKDEINLPPDFDEAFAGLDAEIAHAFVGV